MSLTLQTNWLRGVLTINGGVEIQVVHLADLERIRSGEIDSVAASRRLDTFTSELEDLLDKYHIDRSPTEHLT